MALPFWSLALFLTISACAHGASQQQGAVCYGDSCERYSEVVRNTVAMIGSASAQALAKEHEMQIMPITWEDTGRFKGSAVGPNISDMTIQVQEPIAGTDRFELVLTPVIRYPNFSDKTADIPMDLIQVVVVNEKGIHDLLTNA